MCEWLFPARNNCLTECLAIGIWGIRGDFIGQNEELIAYDCRKLLAQVEAQNYPVRVIFQPAMISEQESPAQDNLLLLFAQLTFDNHVHVILDYDQWHLFWCPKYQLAS